MVVTAQTYMSYINTKIYFEQLNSCGGCNFCIMVKNSLANYA